MLTFERRCNSAALSFRFIAGGNLCFEKRISQHLKMPSGLMEVRQDQASTSRRRSQPFATTGDDHSVRLEQRRDRLTTVFSKEPTSNLSMLSPPKSLYSDPKEKKLPYPLRGDKNSVSPAYNADKSILS
jgi:hypothetical protein